MSSRRDFGSLDDVASALESAGYLASREIATSVFLADKLAKPLLVEGPAGVGKTELARAFAEASGCEFIRLQCYEGLDEAKALYEWEYAKQLLYTQILKDRFAVLMERAESIEDAVEEVSKSDAVFFSRRFLLPRPLLQALVSEKPVVLLIDEIDKADPEFEAFLLELLSDYAVSIPEIGRIQAVHIPRVILTSNASRELSDALKRRCLHLFIDFPKPERELEIVRSRVPGIDETLVRHVVDAVSAIRRLELKKAPSISETLDWARALVLLNATSLDPELVSDTLNVVLKYETDVAQARAHLKMIAEP